MIFALNWLFLFVVTAITMYLLFTIITLIFNSGHSYKRLLLFSVILSLVNCIPSIFTNIPSYLTTILYFILSFVMYILLLKYNLVKSFVAVCIQLIIAAITEYLSIAIILASYPAMNLQVLLSVSVLYQALFRLVVNALLGLIILLIYFSKIRVNLPKDKNKKSIISIILNFIFTILLIFPNLFFLESNKINTPNNLFVYNSICITLLFLYNIYTIIVYNSLDSKKLEIESQKLYINTLEESLDKIRSFKHDFGNIMQSILGYVKIGDLEKLKTFISHMQIDVNYVDTASPINKYLKKYPALYGIFLSKLSVAEIENIHFNISILSELNLDKVRMYELCKILGIFLDNAFEACKENEHNKMVIVDINKLDDITTQLLIRNTYKAVDSLDKIYSKGYSSKPNHTGFGLWEVRNLVNRYNKMFELNTKVDEPYFSQTLTIKNV